MKMKSLLSVGLLACTTVVSVGAVMGDEHGENRWFGFGQRQDVAPVSNALYAKECGSCHFAYQPGLLPVATWNQIMGNLAEHFGENAELTEADRGALSAYLNSNAADRAGNSRFAGIGNSMQGQTDLRISTTRYFQRKHHEVPPRLVNDNPKVGSFARCDACHTGAAQGNYDEHQVRIPGVGRWDDD